MTEKTLNDLFLAQLERYLFRRKADLQNPPQSGEGDTLPEAADKLLTQIGATKADKKTL